MAKTTVVFWALLVVSLCTLAYASHVPDARDSVVVGGEDGLLPLVRSIHFGRVLLTKKRRTKRSKKVKRSKRTRNCNGNQSVRNRITSRGGSGGGGGAGGLSDGGDGGDGGESFVEPQSVNLCVSGESKRNNNQNIRIVLD